MQNCVGVIHRYWICAYFTCAEFGEQTFGNFLEDFKHYCLQKRDVQEAAFKIPVWLLLVL